MPRWPEFLHRWSAPVTPADDCVLPPRSTSSPNHHLLLRRIEHPVRLNRFPVTVGRNKRFSDAIERHGLAQWDHPAMPAGYVHQP